MTMTTQPNEARSTADVEDAISSFTAVLDGLRESHSRLERRAERVEQELCAANEALAAKVAELDGLGRHLEAILSSIPTGVVAYDDQGRIVRANRAACELIGTDAGTLLGTAGTPAVLGAAPIDGTPTELACADGETRVLTRRHCPIRSGDGEALGTVEVLENHTALVRAREQVHRLDKTSALGTMVGGVAHEIRNPLHAIQGFAQLLSRETGLDTRARRHAERIRAGAQEIESIVASMLGVASNGTLFVTPFDGLDLAEETVDAELASRAGTGIWDVEICGEPVAMRADRLKVRQSLRNLIANACDAQPGGGQISLHVETDASTTTFHVDDAGPGVADENADRICDPFFTTRAEGTGLGLALVARIAELHGGSLALDGSPSPLGGARFSLHLPKQSD